jgi:hypothetical protein
VSQITQHKLRSQGLKEYLAAIAGVQASVAPALSTAEVKFQSDLRTRQAELKVEAA